jgi:peptidyl-prolyl cis-trans isomerase SurA
MRIVLKLYLIVFCLVAGNVGTAWSQSIDRIVAVVNGDIILYSELQEQVAILEKNAPEFKMGEPDRAALVQRELLQQMIRDKLAEQEATRLKISVTQREVDEAVANIKKDNQLSDAQFQLVLQQNGQTPEQFHAGIKKELERSRLIDRVFKAKTVITEDQINSFLKTGQSGSPLSRERRRLGVIFIPSSEGKPAGDAEKLAKDIHGRLKRGEDFAKLAIQHSHGPAAQEGGDIGYISSDEIAPFIEAAVRNLKKSEFSDLVTTPTGFYIFKILDAEKEVLNTADAGVREKARRQLLQQEVNRKFEEWVKDLESKAFIKISL